MAFIHVVKKYIILENNVNFPVNAPEYFTHKLANNTELI